jgi:hypothetical protein
VRPPAWLFVFLGLSVATSAHAATCSPSSIAVDTTDATGYDTPILGEAFAQVFTAAAPSLSSVTVWRSNTGAVNGEALHLFVTRADSAGRPEVDSILADGGIVVVPAGSSVPVRRGEPVRRRFLLDAPSDEFVDLLPVAHPDGISGRRPRVRRRVLHSGNAGGTDLLGIDQVALSVTGVSPRSRSSG